MTTAPLELVNLVKTYKHQIPSQSVHALKGVNLKMNPGEILGLLGPNGAGKTTIISILTTIEEATSGQAFVFGQEVKAGHTEVKNHFGLVPQEIVSHGFFSVKEVLKFVSGYHGLRHNEDYCQHLIARLGLKEHENKKVAQLSGGMKRRFSIAKALVHKPKLLLLDEPTAGVDIELRNSLWEFVRDLNKQGTSVLLTTHYLEEAEELCDRVAIIDHGEIKRIGPTKELIKNLTQRQVRICLKKPLVDVQSPYLIHQTHEELVFRLPSSMVLGDLISSIQLDMTEVTDFQIQEGSLEDAFLSVLEESR